MAQETTGVGHEENDGGVRRKLEPFISGAVASQNSAHPKQDTQIPKRTATDEQKRMPQGRAA